MKDGVLLLIAAVAISVIVIAVARATGEYFFPLVLGALIAGLLLAKRR